MAASHLSRATSETDVPSESFVHLHVHTDFSMLDGAARIDQLIAATADLDMPAIAMTDHGTLFGAFEFWKTAKRVGINPIIGIEGYLTPGTHRTDHTRVRWGSGGSDDVSGGGAYTHLTMLAENTSGMHNLFRLASLASIEGQYFKPRMDRELLAKYGSGIIATTGCPGSEVQTRLRLGQFDEAVTAAADYRDIFGKDNYFVELMDHGIEIERRTRSDLLRLAQKLDLPLLATNDLHYTHQADAKSHEALLCVQSGSNLNDPDRFRFDGEGYYLKSAAEMRHLFRDLPEACDNTLLIAERCNVEFDTTANYMPVFPVPEGETEDSWFTHEVERGLKVRYPGGIPDDVRRQADYEIEVITAMGFPSYFLVVADFINWAKDHGIRVGPGRGSGAGSMAAYAMRITDLDPLKHGLIFERFLNPDRVSMPDFDIDFDDRRRGEVIRYVTEKYGDDRVAQIVTFGTIKAKQALKDATRVLGYPYSLGEKLTKAMPPMIMGKDISLAAVHDTSDERHKEASELKSVIEADQDAQTVFDLALGLENLKRQAGVHAAGVIMSRAPLQDIIPLWRREQDGQIITQFDFPSCEALGLVKMDFLGLRNLTILDDALANIKANRGETVVLEDLELDDPETYALLGRGDSLGVFQLDGGPMRALLRLMKPDNFEDISAVIALYRPGPMGANSHTNYALRKNGAQEVTPIHPELEEPLEEILGGTYGLIIYQEQVMAIARKVAGYSLGQADILRRAMGKKKKEILDEEYVGFAAGMSANGYSPAAIKTLWDILVPFADYAFNKAHSAAYGILSYWTAYLKAHYPAEFMAAILTSSGDARDKLGLYLAECRRMGIRVLSPDVNESIGYFAAVGGDIRFGMGAVKNVGFNVVEQIRSTRREQGAFTSFHDFIKKCPTQVVNRRTVESLIKAGAFDSLGSTRRALYEVQDGVIDAAVAEKRMEATGQAGFDFESLLGEGGGEVVQVFARPEWHKRDKLNFEREMLGMYVSDHPLSGLEKKIAALSSTTVAELFASEEIRDGESVVLAGLITGVTRRVAQQSGNQYVEFKIEDFTGEISVSMFGKSYQEFGVHVVDESIAVLRGRVTFRDDVVSKIMAVKVEPASVDGPDRTLPIVITVPVVQATSETLGALNEILLRHPGDTEVRLKLVHPSTERLYALPGLVNASNDFFGEVKSILGALSVS